MTEKRFSIDIDGITIIDNCTDGLTECKYSTEAKSLCNFLNELSEENEQLRFDFKEFKSLLHSLEEENEQLRNKCSPYKQEITRLKRQNNGLLEQNAEIRQENEQLKCENELLKNSLEMRNGKREKV